MNITSVRCPNCGASATNKLNCEYCGSCLVRLPYNNINVDRANYMRSYVGYPGLFTELEKNLNLQKSSRRNEPVVTDVVGPVNMRHPERKTYLVSIISSSHYVFFDGTLAENYNKTGLFVSFRFDLYRFTDKRVEKQLLKRFRELEIFKLFRCHETKTLGQEVYEYYANFGNDIKGATLFVSYVLYSVYNIPKTYHLDYFTKVEPNLSYFIVARNAAMEKVNVRAYKNVPFYLLLVIFFGVAPGFLFSHHKIIYGLFVLIFSSIVAKCRRLFVYIYDSILDFSENLLDVVSFTFCCVATFCCIIAGLSSDGWIEELPLRYIRDSNDTLLLSRYISWAHYAHGLDHRYDSLKYIYCGGKEIMKCIEENAEYTWNHSWNLLFTAENFTREFWSEYENLPYDVKNGNRCEKYFSNLKYYLSSNASDWPYFDKINDSVVYYCKNEVDTICFVKQENIWRIDDYRTKTESVRDYFKSFE